MSARELREGIGPISNACQANTEAEARCKGFAPSVGQPDSLDLGRQPQGPSKAPTTDHTVLSGSLQLNGLSARLGCRRPLSLHPAIAFASSATTALNDLSRQVCGSLEAGKLRYSIHVCSR